MLAMTRCLAGSCSQKIMRNLKVYYDDISISELSLVHKGIGYKHKDQMLYVSVSMCNSNNTLMLNSHAALVQCHLPCIVGRHS